jgi:hypothetical protein
MAFYHGGMLGISASFANGLRVDVFSIADEYRPKGFVGDAVVAV